MSKLFDGSPMVALGICLWWGCATGKTQDRMAEIESMGVVLEEVAEGSALAEAGLEPGDVLLYWERLPNLPYKNVEELDYQTPSEARRQKRPS